MASLPRRRSLIREKGEMILDMAGVPGSISGVLQTVSGVIQPKSALGGGGGLPDEQDILVHYDATSLSLNDGDLVNTFPDQSANSFDLTTSSAPTYVASGINGNPVVSFDGDDDYLLNDFPEQSLPLQGFGVFQLTDSGASSNEWAVSAGQNDSSRLVGWGTENGDWFYNGGNAITGSVNGIDQNPHIINAFWPTGTNGFLNIDQTEQLSGDPGSNSVLKGITLGAFSGGQFTFMDIDIGEYVLYQADKTSISSDIVTYFEDKWGPIL